MWCVCSLPSHEIRTDLIHAVLRQKCNFKGGSKRKESRVWKTKYVSKSVKITNSDHSKLTDRSCLVFLQALALHAFLKWSELFPSGPREGWSLQRRSLCTLVHVQAIAVFLRNTHMLLWQIFVSKLSKTFFSLLKAECLECFNVFTESEKSSQKTVCLLPAPAAVQRREGLSQPHQLLALGMLCHWGYIQTCISSCSPGYLVGFLDVWSGPASCFLSPAPFLPSTNCHSCEVLHLS